MRRGSWKVFETKHVVVVIVCTNETIYSLSASQPQEGSVAIIGRGRTILNVILSAVTLLSTHFPWKFAATTAGNGYDDEARIFIYLDIDKPTFVILVILITKVGECNRVQVKYWGKIQTASHAE